MQEGRPQRTQTRSRAYGHVRIETLVRIPPGQGLGEMGNVNKNNGPNQQKRKQTNIRNACSLLNNGFLPNNGFLFNNCFLYNNHGFLFNNGFLSNKGFLANNWCTCRVRSALRAVPPLSRGLISYLMLPIPLDSSTKGPSALSKTQKISWQITSTFCFTPHLPPLHYSEKCFRNI